MSESQTGPRRPLPNVAELTCQEVVGTVGDYLDASLAPDERARLEQHLFICPPCVTYIQQYRQTVEATHRLAEEAPAPPATVESFREEVRGAVRTLLARRRAAAEGKSGGGT